MTEVSLLSLLIIPEPEPEGIGERERERERERGFKLVSERAIELCQEAMSVTRASRAQPGDSHCSGIAYPTYVGRGSLPVCERG